MTAPPTAAGRRRSHGHRRLRPGAADRLGRRLRLVRASGGHGRARRRRTPTASWPSPAGRNGWKPRCACWPRIAPTGCCCPASAAARNWRSWRTAPGSIRCRWPARVTHRPQRRHDTRGNAAETAAWARANAIHSLLVVTAGYHMPRAHRRAGAGPAGGRALSDAGRAGGAARPRRRAVAADGRGIYQVPRHAAGLTAVLPAREPTAGSRRPRRMTLASLRPVQRVLLRHDLPADRGAGDGGAVRRAASHARTWRGCGRASWSGGCASSAASGCRSSGLEHAARAVPALIASQHQSAFDTFVWLTLVPRCCYVLKRELLRIPLFGPLMPLAGMIAVDRERRRRALRGLLRDGERAVREGRQIVIFPEGTRAEPGAMLPLQPGVAALAARTGLPVIPVVTDFGPLLGAPGVPQAPRHHPYPSSRADPGRISARPAHAAPRSGAARATLWKTLWAEFAATSDATAVAAAKPLTEHVGNCHGDSRRARAWHSVGTNLASRVMVI